MQWWKRGDICAELRYQHNLAQIWRILHQSAILLIIVPYFRQIGLSEDKYKII